MPPFHVAVVGAGPSGFFAAASLLRFGGESAGAGGPDVRIDMIEMLPTPWGLVRSGVAPDHPKIKSISRTFEKTAEDPRFRFFGNVTVGEHVSTDELSDRYDAVVYAVGTQSDRTMGIPGEDLPGSVPAVDFVGWYNAHPHFTDMNPDISTGRAVVIGNGNVAIDVARILVTDPDVLAKTDIADHALEALRAKGISEVVIAGRRGPLQAAFTTLEVRELGELEGVDVIVDPADLAGISDEDAVAAGKTEAANIKVLRDYATRAPRPGHRRIVFRFATSPAEIKGSGLPFDDGRGTIPHTGGKITGRVNDYVTGWIKRGPSGVIGTNKSDSQDTVDTLVADLASASARGADPDELAAWLLERSPQLITGEHWQVLDAHERSAGEPHGRPRVKLASVADMLRIAHG